MNLIIVGGGNEGFHLVENLRENHYVTLIEKELEVSKKLAGSANILVIQGDGCDPVTLKQAGVSKADVVAAVTGFDVDNLVVCQMAKDIFNVKRTVAKVNDPKNEKIFNKLGVDVAIGSTSIIAKIIEDEVSWEDIIPLFAFKKGNLSIVKVGLPENSPVVDIFMSEIDLPADSVIVAVERSGDIIIPKADFVLKEKDEVIAITKVENESNLLKMFTGGVEKDK